MQRSDEDLKKLERYTVDDPKDSGGFMTYQVRGEDNEGPFEIRRRYKEFDALRSALLTRWPGVFIPPLPPKKSVGNKEIVFINERRHFL